MGLTWTTTDQRTGEDLGPNMDVYDLNTAKELCEIMVERGPDFVAVSVKQYGEEVCWIASACQHRGCKTIAAFNPEQRATGQAGTCASCEEIFCGDHLSDQCGCSDDGSGQYVVDLDDEYCDDCHMGQHEPLEVD